MEGFFAKLTRRRLKHGVFHSVGDLQVAINRFIAEHNDTEAKPFMWSANPDDIIAEYGADTFRLYEMFMGPLADSKPWNPRDIPGCRRFLDRAWRMLVDPDDPAPLRPQLSEASSAALEGDALFL